jgi:hypothetical protein
MSEEEEIIEREDWTPAGGWFRGVIAGVAMAAVLGLVANLVAWHAPWVAANGWVRTGATLASMWLVFWAVHRWAGMTGPVCTAVVAVLVVAIAFSQHVVFAVHGVPTSKGTVVGWEWCSPIALIGLNIWTLFGIAFGVALWRDGVSVGSLVDIMRMRGRG